MAGIIFFTVIFLISTHLTEQKKFPSDDNNNEIDVDTKNWKGKSGFRLKIKCKSRDHIHRHFDSRKQWPHCKTMREVHNQGTYSHSWALATTDAFADRMCVATNGKYNRTLSAQQLIACCQNCKSEDYGAIKAWEYFKSHGVVSGGDYNITDGCQPYRLLPFQFPNSQIPPRKGKYEDKCVTHCYGDKTIDFNSDHVKTRDAYKLTFNSIQKDVQTFGPIAATFDLYSDLYYNRNNSIKGVYTRSKNATYLGKHSSKLIGWGVENGVDYWLLVTAWGYGFGENGTFKMKRGTNECGIDSWTTGGVPNV